MRFTAWTAASRPVAQPLAASLPSGDVNAAIDVNLIGAPGHGFDGAVVPRRRRARVLGAAAARSAGQSEDDDQAHARARASTYAGS